MKGPCDDHPLAPMERVLAGLPTGGSDLAGLGARSAGDLAMAEAEARTAEITELRIELARSRSEASGLRTRVAELEVLRDDLELRLAASRSKP